MRKFTKFICLAAMTASFAMPGFAEEPMPVTPPFQEPQEEWILQFDGYYYDYGDRWRSRDVVIVRDESDIYIKGVFEVCPDAWLKGTVDGNRLMIDNKQFLEETEDGEYVYFYCGSFESTIGFGNTYEYRYADFTSKDEYGDFAIADDGNSMELVHKDAAFWYTAGNKDIEFSYFHHLDLGEWITEGTGFPDVDYMVNMRFQKKGESGIMGIGGDSEDDTAAPMYNLQGQMVDPATAGPGIYIQGGRKIVK